MIHGFRMAVTCSAKATEKMTMPQEILDYFTELIKPLAKSEAIQHLREGIVSPQQLII